MARESKNDMQRIQKGLEEFLENEVPGYRQMESKERDAVKIDILGGNGGQQKAAHSRNKTTGNKAHAKTQSHAKVPTTKTRRNKKKKKKKSFFRRLLMVLIVLCLLVGGIWYYAIDHLYSQIQFEEIETVITEPMKEEGVINILLIGNDSRQKGEDGRSDAMILVSISNETKTIHMTSLLRDMYVEIPGYKNNRLNAAYAYGGPELLMETLEVNFDISVNRYVLVNFQAFANLVDVAEGVDLELTNEEVKYINGYLVEYNILEGRPEGTDYLDPTLSGTVHLNGPQALAYCRIRYIGTDFARTERQRKVLSAIINKAPAAMLSNPIQMINGILPNLTTNLTETEVRSLSLKVAKLLTYDIIQGSVPIEGSYSNASIRGMSVLEVDFEKNKEYIQTEIYGEKASIISE